jgi:hypothetical protein
MVGKQSRDLLAAFFRFRPLAVDAGALRKAGFQFELKGEHFMKALQHALAMAAMAGTLCVAGTALASEPATPPKPKSTAEMNAMRVMVDPETGEVRAPTDEELRALIAAEKSAAQAQGVARSAAPTARQVLPAQKSVVRHKNGMLSVRLSQDSLSAIKAETDASGKTRLVHQNETLTATEDK